MTSSCVTHLTRHSTPRHSTPHHVGQKAIENWKRDETKRWDDVKAADRMKQTKSQFNLSSCTIDTSPDSVHVYDIIRLVPTTHAPFVTCNDDDGTWYLRCGSSNRRRSWSSDCRDCVTSSWLIERLSRLCDVIVVDWRTTKADISLKLC